MFFSSRPAAGMIYSSLNASDRDEVMGGQLYYQQVLVQEERLGRWPENDEDDDEEGEKEAAVAPW